jgi:integrase
MFRHGLRVSEACGVKLDHVDTESHLLHVTRLKGGLSTTQPLRTDVRSITIRICLVPVQGMKEYS